MDTQQILSLLNGHYPIRFSSAAFLREGGCVTYAAEGEGGRYLLKLVSPAFMDTVRQSADIISYLYARDFPVPRIVPTSCGKLYGFTDIGMFILCDFIPGEGMEPGERIEEVGELIGSLHKIMEGYSGSLSVRDKSFFIDRYINQLRTKGYPEGGLAWFEEYGGELWKRVKHLPRGYCHGDSHYGNLLRSQSGRIYLLDFDTSCGASPVFDIMFACDSTDYFEFSPDGYDKTVRAFEDFYRGYAKYRSLSGAECVSLCDFVAIRHFQLQATILEIYGLDCVDFDFIDRQREWLEKWRELCV